MLPMVPNPEVLKHADAFVAISPPSKLAPREKRLPYGNPRGPYLSNDTGYCVTVSKLEPVNQKTPTTHGATTHAEDILRSGALHVCSAQRR